VIPKGLVRAKAVFYVKTYVGGRMHREQKGFDTLVFFADKEELHGLGIEFYGYV